MFQLLIFIVYNFNRDKSVKKDTYLLLKRQTYCFTAIENI